MRTGPPAVGPGRALVPVVFPNGLSICGHCGRSFCARHNEHYEDCPCVTLDEEGVTHVDTAEGLKAIVSAFRAKKIEAYFG